MTTDEQIKANQENSKKSKGPVTQAGLHNSSKNSTKHGFTAHKLVLRPEEEEPFREFQAKHLEKYQPVGVDEEYCAHQVIDNRWRLIQITATETAFYELGYLTHAEKFTATHPPDKVSAMTRALTVTEKQKELSLLNRYQARLTKQAALDFKRLEEMQRIRKAAELKQFQLAAAFDMRAHLDRKPWDPAQFGFVWSAEEISRYSDLSALRREAFKVAGGHKEIVYEDLPKRN